jgi:hypothetical protein
MKCVRRMTGTSLKDKIRNEELRKRLEVKPAIDYIKRQQIKWFGHIIRQKDLNILQRTMIKHYKNITQRQT